MSKKIGKNRNLTAWPYKMWERSLLINLYKESKCVDKLFESKFLYS